MATRGGHQGCRGPLGVATKSLGVAIRICCHVSRLDVRVATTAALCVAIVAVA